MKRFLCVLLVALALVGLMTTVASAEEYATVVSDNGYGVRMREGPGKVYRVITKYDVGPHPRGQPCGLDDERVPALRHHRHRHRYRR